MARKNKVICFSTTQEQVDALKALAPSRDSMSDLLREIIREYLERLTQPNAQK
jgi:hypothetical protein